MRTSRLSAHPLGPVAAGAGWCGPMRAQWARAPAAAAQMGGGSASIWMRGIRQPCARTATKPSPAAYATPQQHASKIALVSATRFSLVGQSLANPPPPQRRVFHDGPRSASAPMVRTALRRIRAGSAARAPPVSFSVGICTLMSASRASPATTYTAAPHDMAQSGRASDVREPCASHPTTRALLPAAQTLPLALVPSLWSPP